MLTDDGCDCGGVAYGKTGDEDPAQLHLVLVVDVIGPLYAQRYALIW